MQNPRNPNKDVYSAANEAVDAARDTVIEMKDDLRSIANSTGRKLRTAFDSTTHELSHAAEIVTKQIKDKPVQSSLIALGAGFLLGALFRR